MGLVVGQSLKVRYVPGNFLTGKSCKAEIFNPSGAEISGSPFVMTELTDPAGVYEMSFAPDVQGTWMSVCYYGVDKAKVAAHYIVEDTDIDDLDSKLDAADVVQAGIKAKTDNLPDDPADQSAVESAIGASEDSIRGVDGDDLKSLSDQIDGISESGRIL